MQELDSENAVLSGISANTSRKIGAICNELIFLQDEIVKSAKLFYSLKYTGEPLLWKT